MRASCNAGQVRGCRFAVREDRDVEHQFGARTRGAAVAWLAKAGPDVICLQETKTEDAGFPAGCVARRRIHVALFGQKSYNGVAIAARASLQIDEVARGLGDDEPDDEARVIAATVAGVRSSASTCRTARISAPRSTRTSSHGIVGCAATSIAVRRRRRRSSCAATSTSRSMIKDVWSPAAWAGKIHCSPDERAALAEVLDFGLVDLFRTHVPDGGVYSWWDYRGVSFFKNQGLRIDYIFATQPVAARCTACVIDRDARKGQDASDHAPVIATLES